MSINNLTVVITTFKSNEKIKNCLRTIDNKCKVLVIENSKDSQFKESIEEEFKNVECILSGANLGYGKANNIGLKKVKTKYALILNPDTRLDSSAIENFFAAINKIPDFAIMAPYIQEKKNKEKQDYLKNVSALEVENVKGFAMFLNLSNFEDENFFDENFFFYFEEIDLCRRLKMKNKKIYLIPNIIIHHDGGASHNELIKKEMELSRNWHWMWSTFYYHKKYKGFLISFMIVFPKLSSALLKVLIYSLFFNKFKKQIYYQRLSGLINSILGKSSWYRPKV